MEHEQGSRVHVGNGYHILCSIQLQQMNMILLIITCAVLQTALCQYYNLITNIMTCSITVTPRITSKKLQTMKVHGIISKGKRNTQMNKFYQQHSQVLHLGPLLYYMYIIVHVQVLKECCHGLIHHRLCPPVTYIF